VERKKAGWGADRAPYLSLSKKVGVVKSRGMKGKEKRGMEYERREVNTFSPRKNGIDARYSDRVGNGDFARGEGTFVTAQKRGRPYSWF